MRLELWEYETEHHNSTVVVLGKKRVGNERIVFIKVLNVIYNNELIDIDFMPFNEGKFEASLVRFIKYYSEEHADIESNENYINWKKYGGVWNVSIFEAVNKTIATINN